MALRSCATSSGLTSFEIESPPLEEQQDEDPRHMEPALRKRLAEAAYKRMADEKKRAKQFLQLQLKTKKLTVKDTFKMHAGKMRRKLNKKADGTETEGHFKLSSKHDEKRQIASKKMPKKKIIGR